MTTIKVLRRAEVEQKTGLSGSSIDRLEARGNFPARLQMSTNTVGWLSSEVDDWITSRPRGEIDSALPPMEQVQSLKRQIGAHETQSAQNRKAQDDEIARLEKIADEKLAGQKNKEKK